MPRIVARRFKKEDLKKVSAELFDTIAEIIERPREAFTLDLIESGTHEQLLALEGSYKKMYETQVKG